MKAATIRTALLASSDVAALLVVHPAWAQVSAGLTHPRSWLGRDPDLALAATCGVLLWLAAAWIGLGLTAGLGTRLPGAAGRLCAHGARIVLPRVLVRVVLGSTGLGLLAAPAAAHAAAPTAAASRPITAAVVAVGVAPTDATTAGAPGVPAPTWPTSPEPRSAHPSAPTWPTSAPHTIPAPAPPTSTGHNTTGHNTTGPDTRDTRSPGTSSPGTSGAGRTSQTRVHRGDSLWMIAAHRLGPHANAAAVAHYWPQLYTANRGVIGDDPSVLHPGQVLDLPAPTPQES